MKVVVMVAEKDNRKLVAELLEKDSTLRLFEIANELGISKARVGQIIELDGLVRQPKRLISNRPKCTNCEKPIQYRSKTGLCRDCAKAANTVIRKCKICKTEIEVTKKALENAKITGIGVGVYCGNICSAKDMRQKRGY